MDEHGYEDEGNGGVSEKALIPLQESQMNFHGDMLLVALIEVDGERQAVVPLRQFCDYLGVDWSGQRQRLLRDEELVEEIVSVAITPTQTGRRGYYNRPVLCLPLEMLPGWMFGFTPSRVKQEYQARVRLYRKKCFQARQLQDVTFALASICWFPRYH